MRTIKDLLREDYAKVYIYCGTMEIERQFLEDAQEEGITFGDGTLPTERHQSNLFSLSRDGIISYVTTYGRILFSCSGDCEAGRVLRVDYGKYAAGEDLYCCDELQNRRGQD